MNDAFDRARPPYPADAVRWLLSGLSPAGGRAKVVAVGAGAGHLSEALAAAGCEVVAADMSEVLLARLARRVPAALPVAAAPDRLPLPGRSADLVVAGGPPERLDPVAVLAEGARVLRAGGGLVLTWTARDSRIPWVRRLDQVLGVTDRQTHDLSGRASVAKEAVDEIGVFRSVERTTYRSWQPMSRDLLGDLVRAEAAVAGASQVERNRMLRAADELYDGYGRGADGMLMPYVTTVLRAAVLPWAAADEPQEPTSFDDDALLIDFR